MNNEIISGIGSNSEVLRLRSLVCFEHHYGNGWRRNSQSTASPYTMQRPDGEEEISRAN